MRRAGSESWRFAHDIDQTLHALLYVRYALGASVDCGRDRGIPPRLNGDLPDRSDLLGPKGLRDVARDWPAWWHNVVTSQATTELGSPSAGTQQWLHDFADCHRLVVDPPEWSSLAGSPALQQATCVLYPEACRWLGPARHPHQPPFRKDVFRWGLVRDAAEATAVNHGVSVGAINGCALVLVIERSWWEVVSPGVALCSVDAATDPDSTAAILREVFASRFAA